MQTAVAENRPHLFTVAEYMKLDIPGHTELLGGVIYDVSPKSTPHGFAIRRLNQALTPAIGKPGDRYEISIQDPIAVCGWERPHSPEIDVAVIDRKRYARTPNATDSQAFIEVSDTTNADERKTKIPLYVAARIPTWHVNIPERQVEFYDRDATLDLPRIFREAETIDVLGVVISVSELFEDSVDSSGLLTTDLNCPDEPGLGALAGASPRGWLELQRIVTWARLEFTTDSAT